MKANPERILKVYWQPEGAPITRALRVFPRSRKVTMFSRPEAEARCDRLPPGRGIICPASSPHPSDASFLWSEGLTVRT